MAETDRALRWDLVLPAAAATVAIVLVLLASTTTTARSERRTLTLEGRMNRVAREVEVALREATPADAETVLASELDATGDLLRGLALVGADGTVEASAGEVDGPGVLEVDLFLGPTWHGGGMGMTGSPRAGGTGRGRMGAAAGGDATGTERDGGSRGARGGRGRRTLRLVPAPEALGPPWSELLLMPVVVLTAAALVALSLIGGRLLVRRQRETLEQAERQRLEELALAGAGLAHQLRTPLATIKGSCQLLLEQEEDAGTPALRRILEQAVRMDHLLGDLLDYARPTLAEARPVRVAELAGELAATNARLQVEADESLEAVVDPEHLRQIVSNLVDNACEAAPDDTPVELAARADDRSVEITVADRGPGPGADPERMFEPYVTGRASGTGLGLPIARSLARANGGELTLAPRPGGGAIARLRLPRAAAGGVDGGGGDRDATPPAPGVPR